MEALVPEGDEDVYARLKLSEDVNLELTKEDDRYGCGFVVGGFGAGPGNALLQAFEARIGDAGFVRKPDCPIWIAGMRVYDAPGRNGRGFSVGANKMQMRKSLFLYAQGYRVSEEQEPYATSMACDE